MTKAALEMTSLKKLHRVLQDRGNGSYKNQNVCNNKMPEKQKKYISSFDLHDSAIVFKCLGLKIGDGFLDIGCGEGDYSMQAAKYVGTKGTVFALDKRADIADHVLEKAREQGFANLKPLVSDTAHVLPVADAIIDVCLLAMVLHIPDVRRHYKEMFKQINRVLKPSGRLAVIEMKKEQTPFGPPRALRLSVEDIEGMASPFGFLKTSYADLGYSYIVKFALKERP